jgi:transposase InsO family protein
VSSSTAPVSYLPVFRPSLLLLVRGHLYNTLVDSGSDISLIDRSVVQSLDIHITPSLCIVTMASISHQQASLGTTVPIIVTPVIVNGTLSHKQPLQPHAFEMMDLDENEYQFIIGQDLMPLIFGSHIPTRIACRHSVPPHGITASAQITTVPPVSSLLHTPSPRSSTIPITAYERRSHFGSLEGEGRIPFEEQPERVTTSTPANLEQEYQQKRDEILRLAHIQEAIQRNSTITGFCNIPESVLRLKIDPHKGTPALLYARQYPLSQKAIEAADPVIKRWLETGKITRAPAGCQHNNPLTVAPKKDENGQLTGFRVCLDVRKLNTAIIDTDHFQIPLIREVLNNLQGCSIFGEFDLAEAYLQFRLHPDSQQYTAFTWGTEQYMFVGCPFGLYNMPSHFQRIIQFVFSGIPATFPYFDNIPFGSRTWDEHETHTYAILDLCNRYNLRIKPSSIKIGQAELNCLGHRLTATGIAISPDKLVKIKDWPRPRTGKQMASFLGLITFIRQHVRHFADLTAEFDTLKRSTTDIEWTDARIHQFEMIKHAVTHAPQLLFPDFNRPFYLATDASCVGIGGVLYQPADGDQEDITPYNIVAICSKKLNPCQRRYSTYKKELYGVVYCMRQFHQYIWGHQLVIITDHKPLVYIQTSVQLAHALQQWLDVILDYHFTIKHRPGVLHVLPDALSRMYEACYTSAWGVPVMDPHHAIQQHQLGVDESILQDMSQPPPLLDTRAPPARSRTCTPKRTITSASASRGGDMNLDIAICVNSDSDAKAENEDKDGKFPLLDNQTVRSNGLPFNEHVEVRRVVGAGYGLFTRPGVTIEQGQHIARLGGELIDIDEFWERYPNQRDARYVVHVGGRYYRDTANDLASLGRYINIKVNGNTSLVCYPPHQCRFKAIRRIPPQTQIFGTYGTNSYHARGYAISVSELPAAADASHPAPEQEEDELEHKHDDPQAQLQDSDVAMLEVEPGIPTRSVDEEKRILLAMEDRGKISPASEEERTRLIDEEHARGHFGREAVYHALRRRKYWWIGIRRDIQRRVRNCIPCLRTVIAKTGFDPATPISAALPWDHIQMDSIIGLPISVPGGYTAILVIVDVCTGFIILRPVTDIRAETIAPILWQLFNDFGFPRVIQSDNGSEYTSRVVQEMVRLSGVEHRHITPYQPRTDGKVERNIGTVKQIIKKHLHGVFTSWPAFVPWAQSCVNNKITQLTGSTPFALMFGRRFNPYKDYSSTDPLDTMHETEWARIQDQMMNVVYPSIAERVALQKTIMATRMNRRTRAINYRKGDIVMLKRHERVMGQPIGTLENEYIGPYMIESKNRTGAITLIASNGTPLPRLVRPNQLKFVSHFSPDFKQDVYEVEAILDHRGEGDNREYKVRWKGYSPDEDTWEPVSNLFDAEWSINKYLQSLTPTQVAHRSRVETQ